jgi:pimeloyl-ACP methyl ester carboxylesterase
MDGTDLSLQNQFDGLTTVFDPRCFTMPPNDLTSWDQLVNQVIKLIHTAQQAHPRRPVYLCGESFGGCLALQLAMREPDTFDRLILINPASSFNRQTWRCWSPLIVQQMSVPAFQLATLGLFPFLVAPSRVSDQNRQALLRAMQSVTPESAAWRLSLLCNFQLDEASLRQLTQPVLIIAAANDRLLPSTLEARRLANSLPQAKLITLKQSGHACLLEVEIQLHQILSDVDFLAGLNR